jgi:hypothetical protein
MAGYRGFSVFAVHEKDANPAFILQHRATEPGTVAPRIEGPLSIVSDVQIHFCPWCGVRLQKHYHEQTQALDRPDLRISL